MFTLIFDTHGGLCNQMYDIYYAINFCMIYDIPFSFRFASLRCNDNLTQWYNVPFNKNALVVNTGLALEYLSNGKFKATNHRVLWNKTKRMSIPFFFEPSYDFKMSQSFLNKSSQKKAKAIIYEKFLNNSLKKFVEYQR